jgi:hypothetical protein
MLLSSARAAAPTLFLITRFDLDLDEDIDEDADDESDDDDFDDDDEDSDLDEDEEEPETWQVRAPKMRQEYSQRSTCGCESPKGRLNLTFQPLTA